MSSQQLQKRSWDKRAMTIDLTDAIGSTDTVSSFESVAMADNDSGVTISDVSIADKGVTFLAAGGSAGTWDIVVRVVLSGTPEERLEALVPLVVVDDD